MKILRLAAVSIIAACLAGACSNNNIKKKPVGNDAGSAEGAAAGGGAGGAGGAEAGPDAAPDVVDAMPDVKEAAPDVVDAAQGCPSGTVTVVASGACLACPADGGLPDGGTPEAGAPDSGADGATGLDGGNLYSSVITCQELLNSTTTFDPTTDVLTVKLDYPLELDSVDYQVAVTFVDADGGYNYPAPVQASAPLVDNTLTLDLSSQVQTGSTLVDVQVRELDAHDACGRTSTYYQCSGVPEVLDIAPGGDAGAWVTSCQSSC